MQSGNHHQNQNIEHFIIPKFPNYLLAVTSLPRSHPSVIADLFFCSYNFAFSRSSYKWTHTYVLFLASLAKQNVLRYIYVIACLKSLFIFIDEYSFLLVFIRWMYHKFLFIHQLMDIWGFPVFFSIVSKFAMNICIQISV